MIVEKFGDFLRSEKTIKRNNKMEELMNKLETSKLTFTEKGQKTSYSCWSKDYYDGTTRFSDEEGNEYYFKFSDKGDGASILATFTINGHEIPMSDSHYKQIARLLPKCNNVKNPKDIDDVDTLDDFIKNTRK